MKVVKHNYWDDWDMIGATVEECLGHSFDKRKLALYRLRSGWLGWLPDWVFTEPTVQDSAKGDK